MRMRERDCKTSRHGADGWRAGAHCMRCAGHSSTASIAVEANTTAIVNSGSRKRKIIAKVISSETSMTYFSAAAD